MAHVHLSPVSRDRRGVRRGGRGFLWLLPGMEGLAPRSYRSLALRITHSCPGENVAHNAIFLRLFICFFSSFHADFPECLRNPSQPATNPAAAIQPGNSGCSSPHLLQQHTSKSRTPGGKTVLRPTCLQPSA